MVEFYSLTFPRFPLRKKEHKSYFSKNQTHDFRTSRCAGYLLDHSGDEGTVCRIYSCSQSYRYSLIPKLYHDTQVTVMQPSPLLSTHSLPMDELNFSSTFKPAAVS